LGSKAVAAIRPDDFSIVTGGANSTGTENTLTALVDSVEYYGRETLFMLRTQDQTPLFVRAQGSAKVGESLTVSIPAERVLVYPSEQSS
jgi:putative spermidine/putrescine transport system ATP-binding protein